MAKRHFSFTRPAEAPARAIVAAATTISRAQLRSLSKNTTTGGSWQDEAWEHYDACGEFRFAANWIGNVLSRVRLFAGYVEDAEDEPGAEEAGRPAEIVSELHGGQNGQSQMLKRLGVHLSVPGESFVVTWTPRPGGENEDGGEPPAPPEGEEAGQRWATLCGDEIEAKPGGEIAITLDGKDITLPDDAVIIRVWRPHPRKHWEADSPGRGLLKVLLELEKLSARVIAQLDSRLAGAGVFFIPDSITFPIEDENGQMRQGAGVSEFIKVLAQAMITPITDRDSASAVVPVIAQAPPDAIEAIRHLSFGTDLDEQTLALRESAIRRLALGVDMPPEVLLGLGESNHWNAWEITENAITQHVEPLLQVICDGLTANYLQPALLAENIPDAGRWVIGFDTSELVNRPNRGPDAIQLYDRGELGGEALRREHGFNDGDAPSAASRRQRDLRDLLKGAGINSETANKLMELLGYVAPGVIPAGPVPPPGQPALVPSTRGPALNGDTPGGDTPRAIPARPQPAPESAVDATTFALQVIAQYAAAAVLEYAGKRLLATNRSYRARYKDVPHHELHTQLRPGPADLDRLLDGAFHTFEQIPEMTPLRAVVERHVRRLLVTGAPLDRDHLNREVRSALTPVGAPS